MENHHLDAPPKQDKNQVKNLKNEIRILKQSQTNSITGDIPKNVQRASTPGGQATKNTEIINVLTFIQETMKHYRHAASN